MCRKQKFSSNKNKKPLTVHNKEKQINQKVFKLIYISSGFLSLFTYWLLVLKIKDVLWQ